ncbi:MAG: hypothetical protein JWM36_1033 [Hyphomicrobiales bacterium]|nr:hypothetical protein [Hyphomicrobiales bacterium]
MVAAAMLFHKACDVFRRCFEDERRHDGALGSRVGSMLDEVTAAGAIHDRTLERPCGREVCNVQALATGGSNADED